MPPPRGAEFLTGKPQFTAPAGRAARIRSGFPPIRWPARLEVPHESGSSGPGPSGATVAADVASAAPRCPAPPARTGGGAAPALAPRAAARLVVTTTRGIAVMERAGHTPDELRSIAESLVTSLLGPARGAADPA